MLFDSKFYDTWYFGKKLNDYGVDEFALVIWKPKENECETEFSCIDVNNIYNRRMLVDPKLHGHIDVYVCSYKGYEKSCFKETLVGRVLTTGGKI